jgi:ComF family protein
LPRGGVFRDVPPVLLDALIRFFYPGACPGCRSPHDDDQLCADCARKVPGARDLVAPPPLEGLPTLVACRYEGVVRELVLSLMFGREAHPATALGALLAGAVSAAGFARDADAVVPMPLSSRRQRSRGFNQAERIAAVSAARLGIPLLPRLLARPLHRPPQAELGAGERAQNVRGAFRARDGAFGRAILLVDDVITTGHTMGEAARALFEAGARHVLCAAVAASGWPLGAVRNAEEARGTP